MVARDIRLHLQATKRLDVDLAEAPAGAPLRLLEHDLVRLDVVTGEHPLTIDAREAI